MEEQTNAEVEVFVHPAKEPQIDHYELTILVVNLTDDAAAGVMTDAKQIVESFGGQLTHEEDMGRRTLAYHVAGANAGNYYVLEFDMDRSKLADLNEKLRITKAVTRSIIVKRPKRTPEQIAEGVQKRELRLSQARKPKVVEEKKERRGDRPARRPQPEAMETKPAKPATPVEATPAPVVAAATDAPAEGKKPLADIDAEIEKLLSDDVDA